MINNNADVHIYRQCFWRKQLRYWSRSFQVFDWNQYLCESTIFCWNLHLRLLIFKWISRINLITPEFLIKEYFHQAYQSKLCILHKANKIVPRAVIKESPSRLTLLHLCSYICVFTHLSLFSCRLFIYKISLRKTW